MSNYAIIENSIVTNIIVSDAAFAASIGAVPAQGAGIGWAYAGGVFTAPEAPAPVVPASVTRRQARQALLLAGLLDSVAPAIAAIPDTTQRALALIEWEDSQVFERHRPLLVSLATALGLNSAALDQLFITASTL